MKSPTGAEWQSCERLNDGQVLAEFHFGESMERVPLSTFQLYKLEVFAQYALHRAFEPTEAASGSLSVVVAVA